MLSLIDVFKWRDVVVMFDLIEMFPVFYYYETFDDLLASPLLFPDWYSGFKWNNEN